MFESSVFEVEEIVLAGEPERIVRGGRHLFAKLRQAFAGIAQIGVIGWSSQGPAQAQNLRDSLKGTDIRVKVGLREGSSSIPAAEAAGFTSATGTLGEMFQVIGESDLVLLLISDSAQATLHEEIFQALRPGATLGLSHGFLLAHLNNVGHDFPATVNVVAVCPKGMGPSVRRLYEQGEEINGAGINCSFAVQRDIDGRATDIALGWAAALGAPYIFYTTLQDEYRSDVFGERGILLGAIHGIAECVYRHLKDHGADPEQAFLDSAKSITAPIGKTISRVGIRGVYEALGEADQAVFRTAYCATYGPALEILSDIYDEVASGNEIRSVVAASARHARFPMGEISTTEMWRVGRNITRNIEPRIHPLTAGVYIATMMAQVDLLKAQGHAYSEIVNESIIEAVDSLNPYMDYKDVAFMVDNCSTTARLGARKWAPRFDYIFSQQTMPVLDDDGAGGDPALFEAFLNNPVHEALAVCLEYRPAVDISIVG